MPLRWMAATLIACTAVDGRALPAGQVLLLEVHLNGRPAAQIGEFTLNDGKLFARRSELHELGLEISDASVVGDVGLVSLSTLSGFSFRLDLPRQAIYLTVTDALLIRTVLRNGGEPVPVDRVESGTGMVLDYDLTGSLSGGHPSAAGRLDLRGFSPWGTVSSGFLVYLDDGLDVRAGGALKASIIRLDTGYTLADATTLRRIRIGDFITSSLAWTRPVRLAGVQASLDFALRPDLITFPLPSVSGSAAVPSTLDVLVNGTRLFSRDIEAGPFTIPQLPVVTGSGTISTTLTNALGRQVVATLPFYATSALLAPGLQSFSMQAGALRRNFGLLSNDYRHAAASITYRRGLSNQLTVEGTAEADRKVVMAGGGAVFNVSNIAVVNAAAAASTGAAGLGTQLSLGAQRNGGKLSVSGSVTVASRRYRDLAADGGDPSPRLQINASAGWTMGRFGAIGLAFVGIKRDPSATSGPLPDLPGVDRVSRTMSSSLYFLEPAVRAYVASASYSAQIRRLSVFATAFRDFATSGGSGGLIGLALPLGRRSSVSANAGISAGSRTVQGQATQSAVATGDWGYQLVAAPGKDEHAFGELRYKAPFALLSGGVDYSAGEATLRAEAQGSVALLDHHIFASTPIYDSFAVVDTNGLAGVHVRDENRDVGVTNAKGRLLVPELRSFDLNNLSIESSDVPLDAVIDNATRQVRPQDRSGVIVNFPIELSHAALLRIVGNDKTPIPIGSTARLVHGDPVPVGYDGATYLPGLSAHNDVQVERADGGHCVVRFDFTPKRGTVPVIGPLLCLEQAP